MEFTLGRPAKVAIKIDGQDYLFPMFLGEAFEAKTSAYQKSIMDNALAEYDKNDREGRARFRLMYQIRPVDALDVEAGLKTPKGCNEVIQWCGEHAEPPVPKEKLDQLISETPVPFKRQLAGVLLGTEVFASALKTDSGEPKDKPEDGAHPLTESGGSNSPPPPGSDAAPTPGTSTPLSSPTATPEQTPAS